jgi:histidine ammonia-lyase
MVANLNVILGVELLCAAQGVEFRAPLVTSKPLQHVLSRLRAEIAPLSQDRLLAPDMERAARLIGAGEIARAAHIHLPSLHLG